LHKPVVMILNGKNKPVSVSKVGERTLVVDQGTILSIHSSINGILVSFQPTKTFIDGVDGELGQGMVDSIGLHLADGLQAAGLILNVHVVEGSVHKVDAREENIVKISIKQVEIHAIITIWPNTNTVHFQLNDKCICAACISVCVCTTRPIAYFTSLISMWCQIYNGSTIHANVLD